MKNIIGREEEKKQMKRFLNSRKAEFVALYGRRRVGKTFFVKEFFQHKFAFYFSGAENANKNQQLYNFTLALNEFSNKNYPPVKNWQDAFAQLKDYLQKVKIRKRKVIFIDELPWLDNHKSGFLSAFEYFWNTYASSDSSIFLVTSGSATSWMINKIIKNRGGLHNRVTRQMLMKPFTLKETKLFLESKNIKLPLNQIAECYMIFGGIPYYLEQLEKEYSLAQNVDRLLFRKATSVLREEYKRIYHSLFKNPENYIQVIEALTKKRKGLTRYEISKYSGLSSGGTLTNILEELEQCGFITIYSDFSNAQRNKLYQLTDFYSLFYLSFIKGKRVTNADYWSTLSNSSKKNSWAGFSFELLCQVHVEEIKKALGISGVISYISGWRSKSSDNGAQIDLIIDRDDNVINLCEMKFSKSEFTIDKSYDKVLRTKKQAFIEETKTKKAIHITMVTAYGVKQNRYWNNIQNEVVLEQLFE